LKNKYEKYNLDIENYRLQFECTHLTWSAVGRIIWRGTSRSFHVSCICTTFLNPVSVQTPCLSCNLIQASA